MWLEVARSSNLPEYPAMYYVEAVKDRGSCPVEVVTDLGTENGLLASIQSPIFNKTVIATTVRSPHNQRIEGW